MEHFLCLAKLVQEKHLLCSVQLTISFKLLIYQINSKTF